MPSIAISAAGAPSAYCALGVGISTVTFSLTRPFAGLGKPYSTVTTTCVAFCCGTETEALEGAPANHRFGRIQPLSSCRSPQAALLKVISPQR